MTSTLRPSLDYLNQVVQIRQAVAQHLSHMAKTLTQLDPQSTQGTLGLDKEYEDLDIVSRNLHNGVFRLMILGDMKRGKSTFLNALLGESLLPTDVNPCTAVLTVVRYGPDKTVTIYFKDGHPAETLDFRTFKQQYTLDPTQAKTYQDDDQLAFPDVSHAQVEYPLPLLEDGVEIVDSPGLNDSEALNQLSLSYLHNCHAILFVLRADQPLTLNERRYLDIYIKGRGLSVFFLINAWDEVRRGLIDPEDLEAVQAAEAKLRQLFRTNLTPYTQVNGQDLYDQRVFEVSSLEALRRCQSQPDPDLDSTGFPTFLTALDTLLSRDRALVELHQAHLLARQVYTRVHDLVERRIPLLNQNLADLEQRVAALEPAFKELEALRDTLKSDIRDIRDREARAIADSFKQYLYRLEDTFDEDFFRYQPAITLLECFQQQQREAFLANSKRAFERYLGEKMAAWEQLAEQELITVFQSLTERVITLGSDYQQITERITAHLLDHQDYRSPQTREFSDDSPGWARWAAGFFSLASGNIAGVLLAYGGFSWKDILVNWVGVIGTGGFFVVFLPILVGALGPLWIVLLGLGIGAFQLDQARRELTQALKKAFIAYLPQLADHQWPQVHQLVIDTFDRYEHEVIDRMTRDIQARRTELDSLIALKASESGNREAEIKRLSDIDAALSGHTQAIEAAHSQMRQLF